MNVLAMVQKEFNINPERIYLTGHSMGGAGTYFLGSKHADIWAAVAPVAPAAFMLADNREEYLGKLLDNDVVRMQVHGDADEGVSVDTSQPWIGSKQELGLNYEFVELEGATHDPVITDSQQYIFDFFGRNSK